MQILTIFTIILMVYKLSRLFSLITMNILTKIIPNKWRILYDDSLKFKIATFKLFECKHCQVFWFSCLIFSILPQFALIELSLTEVLLYSLINYNVSQSN